MNKLLAISFISLLLVSCTNEKPKRPQVSDMQTPVGENASLPHLITGENDQLYLSWIEKSDSGVVVFYYATMIDDNWSQPELIASGNDWFVNWADYPMIAVDKEGNMVAHYLAKSASGTYSYDVNIRYKKANSQWQGPVIPHTDGTPTEHGFATLLPKNDGTFLLAWLDGRNTGSGGHEGDEGHDMGGAMTIRTAVLDMEGNLSAEAELDGRVCDCCQTAGTMTGTGPIIAFRDRSESEVRDMSLVRWTNNAWTPSQNVSEDNWEIKGCPVNGPRLSSYGNGVGIIWFTAANGEPKVKVKFSQDNGLSFGSSNEIATATAGRVDIAMLDPSSAVVSWLAASDTASYIMSCKVNADGTTSEPIQIATTSSSRASGFPQLAQWHENTYFAWTYIQNERTTVKMAILGK
jgi:hypothetical protein